MVTHNLALQIPADSAVDVNRDVRIQQTDEMRVVLVRSVPLLHYAANDRPAEALVVAHLRRAGLAKATELARAFGKSRNTVAGYHTRLERDGVGAVASLRRGPKGPHKVTAPLERTILKLKAQGLPNTQIAARTGVSEFSVRRLLKRKGQYESDTQRLTALPGLVSPAESSSTSEPTAEDVETGVPPSLVHDESNLERRSEFPPKAASIQMNRPVHEAVDSRVVERTLAAVGLLHEAEPQLVAGRQLRCVGVLLAIPLLSQTRLLEVAQRVYGSLKNGFYGLRSTMLTLFLMALLRIKNPEGLKRYPPEILGRLLGLDRSPEVKTLRRKLHELAGRGRAHEFVRETARQIVREDEDVLGYLYVDGHVRSYYGRRSIPKTRVPKRRMILPATTDYWVNDADGDPFFFITTEGNPFLNRAFSRVLDEVKQLLGERGVTFLFDRGGWSAELFRAIRDYGYDFITYRKKPYRDFARSSFERCEFVEQGRSYERWLVDRTVRLKGFGLVRCVGRLCDDGHQTHMITTRKDLSRDEIAQRMFRRWRQENFFKYMSENYALDALVSYDVEPAEPDRLTSNPAHKKLSWQIRNLRQDLADLHRRLGELEPIGESRSDSKADRTALLEQIQKLQQKIEVLCKKRRQLPTRIRVSELPPESQVRLETERKTLTDIIKMMAYRVESALLVLIRPDYSRAEQEGRQLIQEIMHASGDMDVHPDQVTITLEPLSSPHRTRVLEKLCHDLTEQRATYPGTHQLLRYRVRTVDPCTVSG